jgi:hypothetical protein
MHLRQHTGAGHPTIHAAPALLFVFLLSVHLGAMSWTGRRMVAGRVCCGKRGHRRAAAHHADRRENERDQQQELKEATCRHHHSM